MSDHQKPHDKTTSPCPGCGMEQRADCLQGYVGTSAEMCPNYLRFSRVMDGALRRSLRIVDHG